jgi:hypothetical protein
VLLISGTDCMCKQLLSLDSGGMLLVQLAQVTVEELCTCQAATLRATHARRVGGESDTGVAWHPAAKTLITAHRMAASDMGMRVSAALATLLL